MKRTVFLLPFVVSLLCLMGCSDTTLSRSTAEKILREHPPKSITDGSLKDDHATQLKTIVDRNLDPEYVNTQADLAFLDALTASGLLRKQPDVSFTTQGLGNIVRHIYTVIPQEGIEVLYPNSANEDAMYTLARSTVKRVTGVSQSGTEATVVAKIGWEPTDIYTRSIPAVRPLLDKCPSLHGPPPWNNKPYYCVYWPREGDLTSTRSVTFNFKRYDDGWRVEESPSSF